MPDLIYKKYELTSKCLVEGVENILDVGCRDAILKNYLPKEVHYTGFDLIPGENVDCVGSIEDGLPFDDKEFDAVVALDILEHTNDIWFSFNELQRVARKRVIILFPNIYHWSFRFQFLTGKEMNKYVLAPDKVFDRHRWLTSYDSSRDFCKTLGEENGWRVNERILFGGRKVFLIDWLLSKFSRNLGSWATIFVLEK